MNENEPKVNETFESAAKSWSGLSYHAHKYINGVKDPPIRSSPQVPQDLKNLSSPGESRNLWGRTATLHTAKHVAAF